MIYAAGRGTRMAPLTDTVPKPLIPVNGRPLIDYALDLAQGAPVILVNTHHFSDRIKAHLRDHEVIVVEEPDLLETGGGLKNALARLSVGPVITLNSDAIWLGPNVVQILEHMWDPGQMSALLAMVPVEMATGYRGDGDFSIDRQGRLHRGPGFVYSGAQIVDPAGLKEIDQKAFSMNVYWDQLAVKDRLFGCVYEGYWCDVGRPENIALAEELLNV